MDANGSGQEPIIIKKKNKGHHGHHGGAWKVAYADFVTAMMALFIVLWILSQSDSVKDSITRYFNDPSGVALGKGPSIIEGKGTNSIEPNFLSQFEKKERETQRLSEMGEGLLTQLGSNEDFETIVEQIDIQIIDEGLRIEIMESTDDVFFRSGSAILNSHAEGLLNIVGKQLSSLSNKVVIEGHTDGKPYGKNDKGYTNWELSSDRANAARRALIAGGMLPSQIDAIRGYADNRLRNPADPYDWVNRRISIIVKFTDI